MGLLSLNLPNLDSLNATEDPKIRTALSSIQTVINGNLDSSNLASGAVTSTQIGTLPQVRVTNTIVQSIPNSTVTAFTFDTQTHRSVSSMHSTSTNPSRIIAPVAGLYAISATAIFAGNVTGGRWAGLRLNGTTAMPGGSDFANPAGGLYVVLRIQTEYRLAINDYVEVLGWQNSGGALNTAVDNSLTSLDLRPRLEMSFRSA